MFKPIVALPEVAARMVKLRGLAFKAKSGGAVTTRRTVVVCLKTPLVAVTVILKVAGDVVKVVVIVRFEMVEPDADKVTTAGFSEELTLG